MLHIYVRVSTFEQASNNKTSLQEQENACLMYAKMQGCSKYDIQVYSDGGVSGSTKLKTRPEGARMLDAVGKGDTIIAAKLDRIFRSSIDALETVERLKAQKVDLILFDMGTQSVMRDGPAKLFFSMLAAFAEFERGRLVERITSGKFAKKQKGGYVGGKVPYGMRVIGEGEAARLETDPDQELHFDVIRQRMRARGQFWSAKRTAYELTSKGMLSRAGKPYTSTQVARMAEIVRQRDAQQGPSVTGDQGRLSALQ